MSVLFLKLFATLPPPPWPSASSRHTPSPPHLGGPSWHLATCQRTKMTDSTRRYWPRMRLVWGAPPAPPACRNTPCPRQQLFFWYSPGRCSACLSNALSTLPRGYLIGPSSNILISARNLLGGPWVAQGGRRAAAVGRPLGGK